MADKDVVVTALPSVHFVRGHGVRALAWFVHRAPVPRVESRMQLLLRSILWTVIVLAPGGFLLLPLALKRPAAASPAAPSISG